MTFTQKFIFKIAAKLGLNSFGGWYASYSKSTFFFISFCTPCAFLAQHKLLLWIYNYNDNIEHDLCLQKANNVSVVVDENIQNN